MYTPLKLMLSHIVEIGDVTFVDVCGRRHRFGDSTAPSVVVKLADAALERELLRDPELATRESYMHGRLVIEKGTIADA